MKKQGQMGVRDPVRSYTAWEEGERDSRTAFAVDVQSQTGNSSSIVNFDQSLMNQSRSLSKDGKVTDTEEQDFLKTDENNMECIN